MLIIKDLALIHDFAAVNEVVLPPILINNGMVGAMDCLVTDYSIPLRDHFIDRVQVLVASIVALVNTEIIIARHQGSFKNCMLEDILRSDDGIAVVGLVSMVQVVDRIMLLILERGMLGNILFGDIAAPPL